MSEPHAAMRAHPFLRDLPEQALAVIAGCGSEATFAAGEFLMREGDEARTFYLVCAGKVSLEVHTPPRAPIRVESVEAGGVLGLSWLFPPERVHLDGRAIEATRVIALDAARLRAVMDANHDVGYPLAHKLLRLMYERLERVRMQRLDVYGG